MTAIAFFAHDANDAAVLRRVRAFEAGGFDVVGFAMRRAERRDGSWAQIDLGRSYDGRMLHRLGRVAAGAIKAARFGQQLRTCDVIYARNLDMLLCASLALRIARLKKPVIYECLDIHRLMHRRDLIGLAMRRLEGRLLRQTSLIVVSSPAFLRAYFEVHHRNAYTPCLIENRIAAHADLGPRPSLETQAPADCGPLRIGWFGVLRCRRSLALLEALAERFADRIEIVMHGYADIAIPDFERVIARRQNMRYQGRYRSPEDLARLYAGVDLIWAGDFHDAGHNSRWLLPNRLYEGGYFGTPSIAPADSETGKWLAARDVGFVVDEPLEAALPELIDRLLLQRRDIAVRRRRLLQQPASVFLQPADEMRGVVERVLSNDLCAETANKFSLDAAKI